MVQRLQNKIEMTTMEKMKKFNSLSQEILERIFFFSSFLFIPFLPEYKNNDYCKEIPDFLPFPPLPSHTLLFDH